MEKCCNCNRIINDFDNSDFVLIPPPDDGLEAYPFYQQSYNGRGTLLGYDSSWLCSRCPDKKEKVSGDLLRHLVPTTYPTIGWLPSKTDYRTLNQVALRIWNASPPYTSIQDIAEAIVLHIGVPGVNSGIIVDTLLPERRKPKW